MAVGWNSTTLCRRRGEGILSSRSRMLAKKDQWAFRWHVR